MSKFRDLEFRVRKMEITKDMELDQTHRRMQQIEHLLFVAREDMGALRHRIELLERKGGNRES